MKKIFLLCAFTLVCMLSHAQLQMKGFLKDPTNAEAKTNPREDDLSGMNCGIIHVYAPNIQSFTFEGNIQNDIIYKEGEAIIYLSPGTTEITVRCPGCAPLVHPFDEAIEHEVVYKIDLQIDLQKQEENKRKEMEKMQKLRQKLLDSKVSKEAKTQAKQLAKEGWKVEPGSRDMEHQLNDVMLLSNETFGEDEEITGKRYIIGSGKKTMSYNNAKNFAINVAYGQIVSQIEANLSLAIEQSLGNEPKKRADKIEKLYSNLSSTITDFTLRNTEQPLVLYRDVNSKFVEFWVRVAYDRKELAEELRHNIQNNLDINDSKKLDVLVDAALK